MKKILLIILLSCVLNAQSLLEPVNSSVYEFLSKMAQKGIIEFNDEIIPVERIYIYNKLADLKNKKELLTESEIEALDFYLKDFKIENDLTNGKTSDQKYYLKDSMQRYRLFSYSDNRIRINADPVFGISVNSYDKEKFKTITTGLKFNGYIADNVGFSFSYRDNSSKRSIYSKKLAFSPETGVIWHENDFSEINTHISYGWNWGNLTIGKEFINWGYGESGKLVLSNKAPSFPFISLNIDFTDWLSFNYTHAWLSSEVIDSNEVYATRRNGINRDIFREKYLASHTLIIKPVKGFSVSLGESVIYSDRLEISYLMPLMFFRLADHYLSANNNDAGSNSQFFLGVSSRNHIKNTHLYGTLFIDEISVGGLFDPENERNQLGFTLGGSVVDLPVNDLKFTAEFTKIYPFVYRHYIPAQTYENASYLMGHWMGHNADQLYFALSYRVLRGLNVKTWFQKIRKGGDGEVEMQYVKPSQPFLFGPLNEYTYVGLNVKYEIINTGFLFGDFQFIKNKYKDETISSEKNLNDISFGFSYGL